MESQVSITACYVFVPFTEEQLASLRQELLNFGKERKMSGLVLLATEGLNGTVSGSAQAIAEWKTTVTQLCGKTIFKDSTAEKPAFRRWSVKIKSEIVTLKQDDVHPQGTHKHLSPEEWQQTIEQEDVILIDARNDYEVAIGKFKGAMDPAIKQFHEFPEFVKNANLPKDKKVLMYCTGGIRCEKALIEMEKQGYDNVYQLEGGILAYLEKFPHKDFEGECFIFDHRVALDQELKPSTTYGLCPHCGDPGALSITCAHCTKPAMVCATCAVDRYKKTCSKRCANEMKSSSLSVR